MVDQPQRDSLAELLHAAGRRPAPPPADYERVLAASRVAWRNSVRQRSRRRFAYALAASVALIVVGVGALRQVLDEPHTAAVAGMLTTANGAVFAGRPGSKDWRWLAQSDTALAAGTRLRTDATGRAAIRLLPIASLRIAGETDLILQSGGRVELLAGRIYLDTRGTRSGTVEIVTRFGTLRDIGTQFEVMATGAGLRVRTREGAVTLTRAKSSEVLRCAVSEELRVDSQGRIERGQVAPHDAEWGWAEMLAEPPRGPELTLLQLLNWVARETGRNLRYASSDVEARVRNVVLHGAPPALAPVQTLEVALATTDIDFTLLADGTIMLRLRQ